MKRVIFPVFIAQTNCRINAEIVKENIPLLLSKTSLKRARTVIDMNNDKSTSGHYCIEIFPSFIEKELIEEVLILEKDLPRSKKHTQILKLHEQFGHTSVQNLQKLLKNANCFENTWTEIIEDVVNNCETCLKFRWQVNLTILFLSILTN